MPNEPMYVTEEELRKVLSLKPEGYPIPYFPDLKREEGIDVDLWYRFPHMDLIFGRPAKDSPFKDDVDAFYEIRLRNDSNEIVGGKRYYLGKAELAAMFRGLSSIMGKLDMFTGNNLEKAEEGAESVEPED